MPVNVQQVILEVEKGLETEARDRMQEARVAIEHYHLSSEAEIFEYLRESESPFDLKQRTFNESGLMTEIVNILTEHLYAPGPSRTWSGAGGQEFLHQVYSDNHVDAIMLEADILTHCGDAAAIQVDAYEGTFQDKPITLRLWGADEFHVWEDPDDRNKPGAVVTKDMYDQTTRYRLWTPEELRTFVTKKGENTTGGRVATLVNTKPNPYQCLPFAFCHYKFPIRQFWNNGVGSFLRRADLNANVMLSRVSEAILKHLDPLAFIENGYPGLKFIMEPQRFIILQGPREVMGAKGLEQREGPKPFYLQAHIEVQQAWEHMRGLLLQSLKAMGIPQSAVEIEYSTAPSGIMLIINLWPLLQRTRKRRGAWGCYETDLARTILRCAGNYYGRGELVQEAKAGALTLGWPSSPTPITQDWLDTERSKIEMGISSVIMMVQSMLGCGREEAVEHLEQVKEDQEELEGINPDLEAVQIPKVQDEEGQGNGNGQLATVGRNGKG